MPKSLRNHIVYIPDEECYGVVKSLGAYASLVLYYAEGIEHEVFLPNEDIVFIEEDISIGIEREEI